MYYQLPIERRVSRQIRVGSVLVGGDAPISVQSMTNTLTTDIAATSAQVQALADAGADIVRVSVPDADAASAFRAIARQSPLPLVADIHFDYKMALEVADCADCLRVNPGNIGRPDRVRAVIDAARANDVPIRVGVNAGSLEKDLQVKYGEPTPEALVESALRHIDHLLRADFQDFKVSVKASSVGMAISAYRLLAREIEQPLHLGITEAGGLRNGSVKSAMGLGLLLMEGIGDTLRVSLAADPVQEIKVGWDILKALGLRQRGVNITACPGCSRQNFDVISVVNAVEEQLEDVNEPMELAIIGCVVNGPGEAKASEFGITGGSPANLIYSSGRIAGKVSNDDLVQHLVASVRTRVAEKKAAAAKLAVGH